MTRSYDFSPDGKHLVFSARLAGRTEPWSTNFDLFATPADASAAPVNLTAANPAWDAQPLFLPNGDLAWLAQDRPGFESDRFHIMLKEARSGAVRALTGGWDRSAANLGVTADGRELLVTADETGQQALFAGRPEERHPAQDGRGWRGRRLRHHARAHRVHARRALAGRRTFTACRCAVARRSA